MQLQHYSPGTIQEYSRELENFGRFLGENQLEYTDLDMVDIEDYIFSREVAERTRNRSLSAVKSFYRYLVSRGLVGKDPSKDVKSIRVHRKNPVFLSEEEYVILMDTLQDLPEGFAGLRDKTIIALLLTTGVRVSEVVGMEMGNISRDREGRVTLEIQRKGQEMDFVYLNRRVSGMFDTYLEQRRGLGVQSSRVFLSLRNKPLDRTAVYRLVKKYFSMSGIEKKKMGPHVLRHTFATTLMRKNISLYKIKELLNHKNISTTEKYLHLSEEDLKDAVEKIEF